MMGLLSALDLPPAERQRFFTEMHGHEQAQEARLEREADFICGVRELAPRILGEHLAAELDSKHADNTTKLYNSDVARFVKYCREQGVAALGAAPEVVHAFLIETAGDDEQTPPLRLIKRMVSAIGDLHRRAQLWNPCDDVLVRATVKWVEARTREEMKFKPHVNGRTTEH